MSQPDFWDELEGEAEEAAANRDVGGWGYRVALEVGETFKGRYRGETIATGGDYGDQRLFLFWDRDGQIAYMRGHASLVRQIEGASPSLGDLIVVKRGDDYEGSSGTGYSYGVASRRTDDPLPEEPEVDW